MATGLPETHDHLPLDRQHFEYEAQIRRLHDHLYGNANVRTPDGIAAEVLKVLKTLTHFRNGRSKALTPLNGGASLQSPPDELVTLVAEELRSAFAEMNQDVRAYDRDDQITLDDKSLLAVRAHLEGFAFDHHDRDWLGDAIEIFRSLTAKRIGGQFFTHPLVTQTAMDLLEFSPANGDDLVDICAGTGGFLLAASRAATAQGIEASAALIRGVEADPELVRFANANLAMASGNAADFVHVGDSLADPADLGTEPQGAVVPNTHRCLASNPPFGTKITVKDEAVLRQYELARRWTRHGDGWRIHGKQLSARAPDILFIERNLQLAEKGTGRIALVTPYQVLSGPQSGFIRQWVLRNARVRAVIDLPATTFQPHTGTKTSLLVLERRHNPLESLTDEDEYPIFMAVCEHIGHDRRGNPFFLDSRAERVHQDLEPVASAFRAFRQGGEPASAFDGAFVVSSAQVLQQRDLRLNAAFHRPTTSQLEKRLASHATRRGWQMRTIGEVTESIFFPPRFKRNYVDANTGIPFLSGTNISQLVPTNRKYLAADDPRALACIVRDGWILVTRSGSTGVVSSVPPSWDGFAVSDHVIRIVPDQTKLDPAYLQAYLRSEVGQELLRAGIFGSVIDEITPEHIQSIPIPIPPADALKKISEPIAAAERARDDAVSGTERGVAALHALLPD